MSSNSKASADTLDDSGSAGRATHGGHFSGDELRAAQRAALNLMEDALAARNRAEELNVELQRENAERARIQGALQASESQMRLVIDNLPVFIAYCTADERFRFVNQPYADHFGLRVEDVINKGIEEVVGSAAYAIYRQYVEAALAGRTVEFEQAVPYGQGKRELRCAYIPDLGADNKIRGFFALIQDVTAQKLAEEQQARLAAIVTSSCDAIISYAPQGRVLTWNRAAEQLLGWSEAEAVGQSQAFFVPDDRSSESAAMFARALRGESVRQVDTVRTRKDGGLVDVSVTLSPVRLNGEVIAISEVVRDITDRKRWEQELAYQKNLLQLVTDNASSCLLMIDNAGRGTFANAATERITGFPADEMIGAVVHDKIHPSHSRETVFATADCPLECALSGGEPVENFEHQFVHKNGHSYPARCAARPIVKDGAAVGTVIEVHDITAEKQAQESLRASEERLRLALESAGAGMWDLDLETGAMVWSPENCRLYGLAPEQYIPRYETWRALVHPDDLERVEHERAASIRARRSYRVEYRLRRPSGEVCWVASQGRAFDDNHGKPVRMLGINIDVTDRKRAEELLARREEELRVITDSVPSLIAYIDRDEHYRFVNRGYEEVFGVPRAEIIGRTVREFLGPTYEITEPYIRRVLAGENVTFEADIEWPKNPRVVLASYRPDFRDDGRVAGFYVLVTDITGRKRAEEERYKFQALVESSSDYIGMAEPGGNYFYLNPAGRALVGVDDDAMLLHRPGDFIAECDRQFYDERVVPALQEQGKWGGQIRLKHQKTGALIDTHRSFFVVKDPHSGAPLCIGTVSRDVREQKRLERLLTKRVEQLRDADRAKDRFLALLAHELRNPLAPITNAVELIKRKVPGNSDLRWCFDVIDGQLGQMSRILEDLLDVSRITRGKLELRVDTIDIVPVVYSALQTSRPLIDANRHELIVELPGSPICVKGDAARLSQVVANILNNAAKYTSPGGRIELRVQESGASAEICVSDNGQGISAQMLPNIFDMFTQGEAKAPSGLGVGLALAKSLVELHGGKLDAQSAGREQGSQFTIRLPMPHAQDRPATAAIANGTTARPLFPLRILVVDDNREQAATLGALLTFQGHDVRVAGDSLTALNIAAEFVPQVGLIDIGMPDIDGCELARRLRALPSVRRAVLIAQTGWGREADRLRTEEAGFSHHLVKPLNHMVLEELLWEIGAIAV